MPILFFVNCEKTVLFSVKRDLDPPFTTLIQERSHKNTVRIDDVTDFSVVLACACKRNNLFIAAICTKRGKLHCVETIQLL